MTDPNDDDTDDDGLNDYVEAVSGWLTSNGDGGVMRVWSSPTDADFDLDKLNDLREFSFGFNPLVPTDPSAIANLVQIDNMDVTESTAAVYRLNFDELSTSPDFDGSNLLDEGGSDWYADCDNCPTFGVEGRYGYAADFDGVDDMVTIGGVEDLEMAHVLSRMRDEHPTCIPIHTGVSR
ncbi:MAG: hypothetical protein AAF542_24170 [Pseudomonadota bacterium]